ncbi:hypothetical protein LIA77_03911 [Sarocladium implicatum]|nr:hypothetical protein LIA77_03911 [Sarocladium implicatum]
MRAVGAKRFHGSRCCKGVRRNSGKSRSALRESLSRGGFGAIAGRGKDVLLGVHEVGRDVVLSKAVASSVDEGAVGMEQKGVVMMAGGQVMEPGCLDGRSADTSGTDTNACKAARHA